MPYSPVVCIALEARLSLGIKTVRAFSYSMKVLYHPLILLAHFKGGAKRGQHSASLDNVMEIT